MRSRPFFVLSRLPVQANAEPEDPWGDDRLNVVRIRGVLVAALRLQRVGVRDVEHVERRHEVRVRERDRTLDVEVEVLEVRQAVGPDRVQDDRRVAAAVRQRGNGQRA